MVELRHLEAVPRKGQYEMRKMRGGKYEENHFHFELYPAFFLQSGKNDTFTFFFRL